MPLHTAISSAASHPGLLSGGLLLTPLTFVANILFAIGVYRDSVKVRLSRDIDLVSPAVWAFGTVVGGIAVAGVYWLIHHSTLNPTRKSGGPVYSRDV